MICCDTSTLAKYYVPEPESATVIARLDAEDRVALSELARAELLGVCHRRLREGRWDHAAFEATVRQFQHDEARGFWTWLALNSEIVELAVKSYATLPEAVFLRAADCLHLVTAVRHGFTEFHTHDRHQAAAAGTLGLTVVEIA